MNIRDSYIHGKDGKGVVKRLFFATAEDVASDSNLHVNDLVYLLADTLGTQVPLTIPTLNLNTTGSAGSLKVVSRSQNANHYLTFVAHNNTTAAAEAFYTDGDIYYNPNTNLLKVTNLLLSGGNSTSFNFSTIGTASENTARPIWFSYCSSGTITAGTPIIDNDFKYNPSTKVLTVGELSGPVIEIGDTTLYLNHSGTTNKLTPDTTISNLSTHGTIPSSKAVYDAILNGIANNDAMVFKGILTGGNTAANTIYTPAADCGWTYKVGTAGYINGTYYQVNDTFICTTDGTVAADSNNVATVKANWDVIEGNGDYLSIHGGTMYGTLKWANTTALPASTTAPYILVVDATSNGTTKYITLANLHTQLAVPSNTKNFKINGTKYSIFTTYTGTAPTIFAPTTLAGTGGYILATNAAKTGLEWVAANNHTHNLYILLDSGTAEQTIKSSISSLGDGVISLWRATEGGYPMIGFHSGTTKTKWGMLGFSAANTPIFRNTSNTNYLLAHAGNIVNDNITVALNTEKTIATIAGVAIKLKVTGTNNVTTSAVVANSASGTTLITAALANPFYNLLEGGSVTRSIQFKAGTGITISASTGGVITITNSAPDVNHNTDHRKAFYGTCDTAAATAAKVVTISDVTGWELRAGIIIGVKFTNTNTASNVTLAVNSEAAKSIFYNNAVYTGSSNDVCGNAGRLVYYMYDGTYWVYIGNSYIINTSYSTMSLNEITTGTNTNLRVMTAKIINDWLHTKNHTTTGTWLFGSHIKLATTTGITSTSITDAGGYNMLVYSSGNILGAFGDGTTATIPTYIRSTGNNLYHRKGKNSSYTDHIIADSGNIVNDNTTISWNTETTIATIAGVAIKIKIPANPNTWRGIYTGGTSRVGTGTGTKAMNFAVAGNLSVNYLAAGTGSGQSGSADYFTIKITANANAVGVAGYVAAPTKASNPNQVWMTNADGAPAWRTINVSTAASQLVQVEKTLVVSTWTNMATVSAYSGTYAIQINSGALYASGIFSVCGGTDAIIDEIPLHVSSTGAIWRPYARISAGKLQMTTNEATGTARTYTIKILKLI